MFFVFQGTLGTVYAVSVCSCFRTFCFSSTRWKSSNQQYVYGHISIYRYAAHYRVFGFFYRAAANRYFNRNGTPSTANHFLECEHPANVVLCCSTNRSRFFVTCVYRVHSEEFDLVENVSKITSAVPTFVRSKTNSNWTETD